MTCEHKHIHQPDRLGPDRGRWWCLDCRAEVDPLAKLAEIDAYLETRRSPR